MGNMKELEVSGDVFPGSISISNKGFEEEPFFPVKIVFLWSFFPCARQAPLVDSGIWLGDYFEG